MVTESDPGGDGMAACNEGLLGLNSSKRLLFTTEAVLSILIRFSNYEPPLY